MNSEEKAKIFAKQIADAGGKAYYVGGYVRDRLLHREAHDQDIEVYGLSVERLEEILQTWGDVLTLGRKYGIYQVAGMDIALPRQEVKTGPRHQDFQMYPNPFLSPKQAVLRRDFTVNALMEDILSGEIYDVVGGRKDLIAKVLRHISDQHFPEDALRVYRAARLAAQLGFTVSRETQKLMQNMPLCFLAKERIQQELQKAFNSRYPSLFLRYMQNTKDTFWQDTVSAENIDQYALLAQTKSYIIVASVFSESLSLTQQEYFFQHYLAKKEDIRQIRALHTYAHGRQGKTDTFLLYEASTDPQVVEKYITYRYPGKMKWTEYQKLRQSLRIDGHYLLAKGCPAGPFMAKLWQEARRIEIEEGYQKAVAYVEEKICTNYNVVD